jgi:hypothetical protein
MGDMGLPSRAAGRCVILRSFWIGLAVFAAILLAAPRAEALPSYARQTGQECAACHNGFPELTPYGRLFKLTAIRSPAAPPTFRRSR